MESQSLQSIIPAYRMQSQMFNNMLEGIKKEDALKRIEGRTNHITWMVGNLVNCRYWLANILGLENKDPNDALFKDAKALDENANYPSLEALKKEWHTISPLLFKKLETTTEEELQEPYSFGMNVDFIKENKLNMVGMCLDRVSYLYGQLGLMRRILGYEGVKYDMDKSIEY